MMTLARLNRMSFIAIACVVLASCSAFQNATFDPESVQVKSGREAKGGVQSGTSLFEAFNGDAAAEIKVNRFLWTASLEVLGFLPVQNADPFTGVITTGFGVPPGGNQSYRATVLISDPALDARSLNVAWCFYTWGHRQVTKWVFTYMWTQREG